MIGALESDTVYQKGEFASIMRLFLFVTNGQISLKHISKYLFNFENRKLDFQNSLFWNCVEGQQLFSANLDKSVGLQN